MSSMPTCFAEVMIGIPKELSVKLSEEDALEVLRSNVIQTIRQLTQASVSVDIELVLNFQILQEVVDTNGIANLVPANNTLQ